MMQQEDPEAKKMFVENGKYFPQEEMLEVGKARKKFKIGIPKENHQIENRVSLTPESVDNLVSRGHEVYVEKDAGIQASYKDANYVDYGAYIVNTKREIFQCDIIVKVAPVSLPEIDLLTGNQILISSLHFNDHLEQYIRKLLEKKITAIAFENLKDEENFFPIDRTMNEISGSTSILIAAEYLSNVHHGKGVFLGGITGITPAEVVILGAGTKGEFAARAALGLGAHVNLFDNSNVKLRILQDNIGQRLYTSIFHKPVLERALETADVVIGALNITEEGPQYLVTEEMVQRMKAGSVIVDLSIDQGGCFETSECRSHQNPVFTKYNVIHYCIPNVPSRVARTASIALSNVFIPLLVNLGENGDIKQLLKTDIGVRHGVYIYKGILTNQLIGKMVGISAKDLELLMAAF